jgi:hypothetical protein
VLLARRIALIGTTAFALVVGVTATPLAAYADTSSVVPTATTVENQNCHNPAHTGNTFNTRYMFDGDNITVNYTNCNSNYAYGYSSPYPAYAINYGDVYVNVGMSASAGPTGPVAPTSGANYSVPAQDRQCIKVSATDPGAWGSVSFGLPQWTSTMTSAVTGGYGVYVYDQGPSCGGSSGWNFKQIVYAMAPVVPTVSAAFSDASVAPGTPTDLVITVSNTQILRPSVFQAYTGMGYTLALPAGATAGTASANTCRGSSVSGTTSVILFGGALGGTGNETEGTCTVTVPVTFTTTGSKALTDASITASTTNRGAMFTSVSTSINVTNTPPSLSPSTQTLSGTAGEAVTPTTAFTPTGLTAPITFSVSPDLPAGLTLNTSTGVISGTPTAVQSSLSYTITASSGGSSATSTVSISIAAAGGGGGGGGGGGSDSGGANSGLPDTGISLRILGITLGSALMLYIAGVFVFRGRRQLGFAAVNEKVSARMRELDAMLTRMEERARRRRIRRGS